MYPRLVVGPFFARLKVQRFVIKDQFVWGAGFILGCVVGDRGCMRQQMINGDLVPGCGRVREIFLHQIVGIQFSAILKQQDGGCGELLGHGSDVESSGGRIRNAPLQVRHAIALAENGLPIFSDQHASHEHLGIDIRLYNLLETVDRRLSIGCVSQYCEDNRGQRPAESAFRQSRHPAIVTVDKLPFTQDEIVSCKAPIVRVMLPDVANTPPDPSPQKRHGDDEKRKVIEEHHAEQPRERQFQ